MAKILIVDDEPGTAQMFAFMLNNHDCDFATSSSAALELYASATHSKAHYDLIILDLALPFTNGIEVEGKIRATGDNVPVVFLSAYTDSLAKDSPALKRASAVLDKPIGAPELRRAIDDVLRQKP